MFVRAMAVFDSLRPTAVAAWQGSFRASAEKSPKMSDIDTHRMMWLLISCIGAKIDGTSSFLLQLSSWLKMAGIYFLTPSSKQSGTSFLNEQNKRWQSMMVLFFSEAHSAEFRI